MAKVPEDPETEELLSRAGNGGLDLHRLLERHRDRLRRMVAVRLDSRLTPAIDPSDVVQEALADASRKLDGFLRDRPLPFYPWLRRLAEERIIQLHRHHLGTQKRNANRARGFDPGLPDDSASRLADRLVGSGTSPSQHVLRDEQARRVHEVLDRLGTKDREILVLYYLEELNFNEIAAALGITDNAAKVRHFRAMKRVRELLTGHDLGEPGQ